MLPSVAMPIAPPSSELVSERADAAPARSGGAEPMVMSAVGVKVGDIATEALAEPPASTASEEGPPIRVMAPNPTDASANPDAITKAGRMRRATTGVKSEPMRKPHDHGSVHMPAWSGDNSS